jgi:hypothetical protein
VSLTADQLRARFPNASEAFLRANGHLPPLSPAPAPDRPSAATEQPAKKRIRQSAKLHDHKPDRPLPNAEPERHATPALGSAVQGKAESPPRTVVRFVGYRVRPLDPDNFAGSVKGCLDGLRYAGLISGDEPWKIILETEQVKVAHFHEERTEVAITIP